MWPQVGKLRPRGSQWTFKLISREESELMNSICIMLGVLEITGLKKKRCVFFCIVCFPFVFHQKIIIEHLACGRQMRFVVEGWRMKCLWSEGIRLLGGALRQARGWMQQGGPQSGSRTRSDKGTWNIWCINPQRLQGRSSLGVAGNQRLADIVRSRGGRRL